MLKTILYDISQAHGSTSQLLQVAIRLIRIAARWPACGLPTNNQFFRPIATGRKMRRSA